MSADIILIYKINTWVSHKSKSKRTYQKKHVYCKYADTKLILLFNGIPLYLNTLFKTFHEFLIPSEKKFFFLFASLTNFAPR